MTIKSPSAWLQKACESGPAFTITSGVSYGLMSILPAMIGIGVSALAAYKLVSLSGQAARGCLWYVRHIHGGRRMLSIVGMIISNDAYGL